MIEVKNVPLGSLLSEEEEKRIRQKLMEEYLACPSAVKYIKSLGIPNELVEQNIDKISDMVRDINTCRRCPGISKCEKGSPRVITKILYRNGRITTELTPCKRVLERIDILSQFKMTDFDLDWIGSELTNLDPSKGRKQALMKYTMYSEDKSDQWLYLTGSQNSGRSFFAATLTMDLARKKKGPICFINSPIRLKSLNSDSYNNKEKFANDFELLSSCPVLVIDDFGNEFKNDYGVLLQILIKRSGKKLFTIFTSDYSMSEVAELYSASSKSNAIQAKRILEILEKNCKKEINLGELPVYQ